MIKTMEVLYMFNFNYLVNRFNYLVNYLRKISWYRKYKNEIMYIDDSRSNWYKMVGLTMQNNKLYIEYITGRYGYVDKECTNLYNPYNCYVYKYYLVSKINLDKKVIM